jgi:hypothetical protein
VGPGDIVSEPRTRTFYRLAHGFPPPLDDYRTARDKRGNPPAGADEEVLFSWDSLSAFDTEDAARRVGRKLRGLGHLIVRYVIPADADIVWRQTGSNRHHWDLRGRADWSTSIASRKRQLEPYLDSGFVVEVEPPNGGPRSG